ncbi:MAG: hypothetical protein R8M71_02480 [Alphaproteobacteria bacterium]|nr:hypothetical protein [Alphaproteobacteria bacterium]
MTPNTLIKILEQAGFHEVEVVGDLVTMEDPSCVIRGFETFISYAWVIVTALAGILLFGWALSMIRGAKNDIFSNMKYLVLIFGILSVSGFIMETIYGGKFLSSWCKKIEIKVDDIAKLVEQKQKASGYEFIDIDVDLYNVSSTEPETATIDD